MGHNVAIRAAREQNSEKYKAVIVLIVDDRNRYVYNLINAFEPESPDSGQIRFYYGKEWSILKVRGLNYLILVKRGYRPSMTLKANFH